MKYLTIPLLIAVMQLTACGGGGSSDTPSSTGGTGVPPASTTDPEDPNSPNADPQPPGTGTNTPTDDADGSNGGPTTPGGGTSGGGTNNTALDLEGSWMSNCYQSDNTEYTRRILQFQGTQITLIEANWEGSQCQGDSSKAGQLKGTFNVGKQVTTANGTQAYEVDFNFDDNGQTYKWLQLAEIKEGSLYLANVGLDAPRPTEVDYGIFYVKGSSSGTPGDDPGTPGGSTGTPNDNPGTPGGGSGTTDANLNGSWTANCEVEDENSYTESWQFNGSNIAYVLSAWRNTTCSGTPDGSETYSGTYSIGNQFTTSTGTTAHEIDMQLNYEGQTLTFYGAIEAYADRMYLSQISNGGRDTNIDYDYPFYKQ